LGEILTKLSGESFLKKIQTLPQKFLETSFAESFWKLSREILTKVFLPQHYLFYGILIFFLNLSLNNITLFQSTTT